MTDTDKAPIRCESVWTGHPMMDEVRCQMPHGHQRMHQWGGCMWTTAAAAESSASPAEGDR